MGKHVEASDLEFLAELEKPIGIMKYATLQNYLSEKTSERVDPV